MGVKSVMGFLTKHGFLIVVICQKSNNGVTVIKQIGKLHGLTTGSELSKY